MSRLLLFSALNYLFSALCYLKTAFLLANHNREIFSCILLHNITKYIHFFLFFPYRHCLPRGLVQGHTYFWRDPFNQNSDRSDRENWSTSKDGPVFSRLFRLDRTDPLSFGPKFPEILVEWIARFTSVLYLFE